MSIPQHEGPNHLELKTMHDEEANRRDEGFDGETVTAAPWRMRGEVASQLGLNEGDMCLQTPKGDGTNVPTQGPVQGLPYSPLWSSLQDLPYSDGAGDPPVIDAIRDHSTSIHGHQFPVESVQSFCHSLDATPHSSDLPPLAGSTASRRVSIASFELG